MIDFLTLQNNIKDYIKNNYGKYIEEGLAAPNKYIDDYIDLDKYNAPFILFYNFAAYNFSSLSNESQNQEVSFNVYLVVRGSSSPELKEKLLKYTAAFYTFFKTTDSNFSGLVDYGTIDTVNFYEAAEGNTNIKVAELQMKLTLPD